MNRRLWSLLLLCCMTLTSPVFAEETTQPSLLQPDTSPKTVFRYPVNAIDPTPQSNPKGAEAPGFRGEQQLVIYTPAFSDSTHTNRFGLEAIVRNRQVKSLNSANSPIPKDGFVISGHGQAGQWMTRILKRGAHIDVDTEKQQLVVEMTPQVYLYTVEEALKQAQKRTGTADPTYSQYLAKAQACFDEMQALAPQGVTSELITLSQTCEQWANKAFYRTVASNPSEFRGIWVRPIERTPEQIEKAVADLKAAHIEHLFLETYAEGATLYPSGVMTAYGFPSQQYAFQGWDPLQVWIDAAHRHGLKVHAWVQVFFAGNRNSAFEAYGPILSRHPDWANVQRVVLEQTKPMASTIEEGHYFVDPANPEVRGFLESLILELVTQYSLDGLNLDYVRYPASHPMGNPAFLASTWGYTPVARQTFQAMIVQERLEAEAQKREALLKAGKPLPTPDPKAKATPPPSADPKDLTPNDPLWPRWVAWRKEQVSSFMQSVTEKALATRPNLAISAVVFPQFGVGNQVKLQDWPRWVQQGWVHALTPIGLRSNPSGMYQDSLAFKRTTQDKAPVYVGIFGMYNRDTPVDTLAQIEAVRRAGLSGVVLFERSRLTSPYQEALLEGAFREEPLSNDPQRQSVPETPSLPMGLK